ncbi:MAG: hypothetical protein ABL934_10465 [Lysobacteraceae bacterium]
MSAPATAPRLLSRVVAVNALDDALVASMHALHAQYYDACEHARFERDLANKRYVIVLDSPDGLAGFSTVALDRHETASGPALVLFSGDTIIDRDWWGDQTLSRRFARLAGALHAAEPGLPLYWLLISKGHRTYRYLGLFSRRYFPHHERDEPPLRALAEQFASARFGADYDPARGVIRFAQSQGHLKADLADVPPHVAARPEAAFFLARNPGYRHGDELVCLTRLCVDNLRAAVRSGFEQGMRDGMG